MSSVRKIGDSRSVGSEVLCGDDALSAPRRSGWRGFVLFVGFGINEITELVAPDHRRGPNRGRANKG